MSEKSANGEASQKDERHWRERRVLTWVPAIALIVAALGLFSRGSIFGHDLKPTGKVSLDEVVVRNGRYDSDDVGLHGEQTIGSSPTLDLTLLNSTSEPVLVERAKVRVIASTPVPECYTQGGGDVPANAPETITLPSAGGPSGRQVTRALHHFVPAHGLERFLFRFKSDGLHGEDYALYRLDVTLTTSGGQRLSSGDAVIAAPAAVPRDGLYVPEDDDVLKQAGSAPHLDAYWCFRHNIAAVRQARAWPGEWGPDTRALVAFTVGHRWQGFADHTPPRRAARQLLTKNVFHIEEAAYAAEATHDPGFIRQIKTRCAGVLIVDARSELRERFPQGALQSLLRARDLADSPQIERLIGQTRSQLDRNH